MTRVVKIGTGRRTSRLIANA